MSGDAWIRSDQPAIDAATAAGVGRVVYTSFTNPTRDSLFPYAAMYAETEARLEDPGLSCTILRNNQYAGNLDSALAAARATGTLALPGPEGKVAFITHTDVAAATAGALTGILTARGVPPEAVEPSSACGARWRRASMPRCPPMRRSLPAGGSSR